MKNMIYAGIGTRRRMPKYILDMMTSCAYKLDSMGYILRSGGAAGSDKAFEEGVSIPDRKNIFLSKDATIESKIIASNYHRNWDECTEYVRKLHGRNALIILGSDLETPVDFVICYTPDGKDSGGTGLGMRIADDYNIPIFNLFFESVQERIKNFLNIKVVYDDFL